jgi:cell division initiation protein
MRITPLDLRNHQFGRRLRGLDPGEVESFLQLVSEDYEDLLRGSEGQTERIRQLEHRVEQLVADERLLKETLLSAQAMTSDLREAAIKESEVLVGEAEVKAEKILDAAHRRATRLSEEIREMRGLRSRLAEALRTTITTHLSLIDSIEEASHEDHDEGKVTYLARTPAARDAARDAALEAALVDETGGRKS